MTTVLRVTKRRPKPGRRGRKPGGGDDLTSRMTEAELDELVESRRDSMPVDRKYSPPVIRGVSVFEASKFGKCAVPVRLTCRLKNRPPSEW